MRISDWSSDVCSSDLVGLETPDAIGAEIRFGRGGMAFVTVRLGISLTAEPADFLRAEPDDADRAAGLARRPDPFRGRRRVPDAGGVVARAGAAHHDRRGAG